MTGSGFSRKSKFADAYYSRKSKFVSLDCTSQKSWRLIKKPALLSAMTCCKDFSEAPQRAALLILEGYVLKKCYTAEYKSERYIYETSDKVPQTAALLFATKVYSLEQLILAYYVEP